jgi:hypothetical protein
LSPAARLAARTVGDLAQFLAEQDEEDYLLRGLSSYETLV